MQFKSMAALSALFLAVSAQAAGSLDVAQYSVSYDDSTSFGNLSGNGNGSGGSHYSFSWTVPDSVQVASFGPLVTVPVALPSFTVAAKPGWALSDLAAILGNLSYVEVGGATTGILWYATVSVDGGPAVPLSGGVPWTATGGGPGFTQGYFGGELNAPSFGFHSFSVTDASIVLSATGGSFSNIAANPQNKLEVGFTAVPVPEPETYAMMLAGLAALGWLSLRRRPQGRSAGRRGPSRRPCAPEAPDGQRLAGRLHFWPCLWRGAAAATMRPWPCSRSPTPISPTAMSPCSMPPVCRWRRVNAWG